VGADVFRNGLGQWIDRVAGGQELLITRRGRPVLKVSLP
jgi:prevent-host-death family protein